MYVYCFIVELRSDNFYQTNIVLYTMLISSVCEQDAPDVQCYTKIDRPPRVCCLLGVCTFRSIAVRHVNAVITVVGVVITEITDLVRRTIECYVHIETTFHRHYTT